MNPHLRRASEDLQAADSRAFVRRVMWIDFEERLAAAFSRFCPKREDSDYLGSMYLTVSSQLNPAYVREHRLRPWSMNQAQVSVGHRRLGFAHTLNQTDLARTKDATESGATISFSQNVTGHVSVVLFPYKSELARVREENIMLAFGLEPVDLTQKRITKYLQFYARYCSATSASTLGSLRDYRFRLRLMFLDRRNRAIQNRKLLVVTERVLIVVLAALSLWATLYTAGK